jgi:hypothetical protein
MTAADNKLRRALRRARRGFIKTSPIAESSVKLSDIPIPTETKLTRKQRQAARICGVDLLTYARCLELLKRRDAQSC